jgi:hypothetical protein
VLRIKVPPTHFTIILEGIDAEGNPVSRIAPVGNVEITTKVINLAPPAKPYRIGSMPTMAQ